MKLEKKIRPLLEEEIFEKWGLDPVSENEVSISYSTCYIYVEVIVTESGKCSSTPFAVECDYYNPNGEMKFFPGIEDVVDFLSELFEAVEADNDALERNPMTTIL